MHLRQRWRPDEVGYELGRDLFSALRDGERPKWAADVLRECQSTIGIVPEVEHTLAIAAEPSRWKEGHQVFAATRPGTRPHADADLVADAAAEERIWRALSRPLHAEQPGG